MPLTPEETLRYGTDADCRAALEAVLDDSHYDTRTLEDVERHLELAEEQAFFARSLLDEIEAILARESRASHIKRAVKAAISNSQLER